jgi:hypothetical protein
MEKTKQPEKYYGDNRADLCNAELELDTNFYACDLPAGHTGAHISNDELVVDEKTIILNVAWKEKT